MNTSLSETFSYQAYNILRNKWNSSVGITQIFLQDENKDRNFRLEIYSAGGLQYGTYETVSTPYDIKSTNKVYIEHIKGVFGWPSKMIVYSVSQVVINSFKYEKLDDRYDLLTFGVMGNDKGGQFTAELTGRFKIRK
jgi:hypothetical protein